MEVPLVVVPGQYVVPGYQIGAGGDIERYYAGKGTIVTHVDSGRPGGGVLGLVPVVVLTILGRVRIDEVPEAHGGAGKKQDSVKAFRVTVVPKDNAYASYEREFREGGLAVPVSINLPKENDIVLVRITRITSRQAHCEILCVEGFGNVLPDSGVGANGELSHVSVSFGAGAQSFTSHMAVAANQSTASGAVANDVGENFKGIIRSQDVRATDRDKVKIIDCFRPGDIVRAIIISLGDGTNYYLSTARNDFGVLFAKSANGLGDLMFPIDWQTMVDKTSGVTESRKCAKPFKVV